MICSRFRVRPVVPRSSVEKDGGRAETMANSGVASDRGDGFDAVKASRNELNRGLVRILRGTSSRMEENERRWLIRL